MVWDPVEGGVAEGKVRDLAQIERVERLLDVLDPTAELRLEVLSGSFEHVGRTVDGEHAAVGQAAQQELGQPSTTTAKVERRFVAA